MTMTYALIEAPVGQLLIAADAEAVREILFENRIRDQRHVIEERLGAHPRRAGLAGEAARQIRAYFDGQLSDFDLPLAAAGTPFQRRVWEALRGIPYGETISYGELARRIGNPKACRAVGAANGRNPLPIVVPCHRVIGRDGTLTGFGGGLEVKERLIEHERRHRALSDRARREDQPDTFSSGRS